MISCSLIISTYNWPGALSLCLKSVQQQQVMPSEVIIADDGSGQETADLIREWQQRFPVPLKHIWHPDEGFRLAAIRNKAIASATGEYIIQVDGDLILHAMFVADHLAMQRPGYFSAGSRVMLPQSTSALLLQNQSIDVKALGNKRLIANGWRSNMLRRFLADRYKITGKHKYYVKGCNMAFYKADLLKVNGYNEAFRGWGSEDREIAIRLINAGLRKQSIKMGAVCYHLYHPVVSRKTETENEALMQAAIDRKLVYAPDGLNKYLAPQAFNS